MIPVLCPHCGRRYRTMTEGMGRTAVCTKCHQTFIIGSARPKFTWRPEDFGMDSWIGVAVPEEVTAEVKHCIICDAPLEPGAVRCKECGANQITGVVQRQRKTPPAERISMGGVLPVRWILVLLIMAAIAGVGYWLMTRIAHSFVQTGQELIDQRLAMEVAGKLDAGADRFAITDRYAGRVSDRNLAGFVRMLSGAKPSIRQAAERLIGCGHFTDLKPILDWAEAVAPSDSAVTSLLDTIGERRLIELSCHAEPLVRGNAALILIRLAGKSLDDKNLFQQLTGPSQLVDVSCTQEKQHLYNELYRPWPEATGRFAVQVNDTTANFEANVQQFGRTFYFAIGKREFKSSLKDDRSIVIPIDRWCEATGAAVDAEALRKLLAGEVRLASPTGAGWRGTIRVAAREKLNGPLPGFLPFDPPEAGEAREVPIKLARP